MDDRLKVALIIAGGIIIAVCIYVYFSPYQTCVRSLEGRDVNAGFACTLASGRGAE